MADRRMFARTIIESDAFTTMSPNAQILYIHLCMHADDDGFLNNALGICKWLEFGKETLDELFKKRFLLDMGDGITVIKGWLVNNSIRKDRYKPTIYQDKFEQLKIKEDGSYTERYTNPQPNGNQTETQSRLGKDREEDLIKEKTARMLEMGYSPILVDKALTMLYRDGCPHTAQFYQTILNTLTDESIYNKEGYIYECIQNERNKA